MSNECSTLPLYQMAQEMGLCSYLCFPIGLGRGPCTLVRSKCRMVK